MNWTAEQLDEVEKLASIFYSIKEIIVIMQLPKEEVMEEFRDEQSALFIRYQKGFLRSDAEIRISEIGLAKRGSTPALASAHRYIQAAKTDNY